MFTLQEGVPSQHALGLLRQGAGICEWCSVSRECLENARPEDLQWTVRAGRLPSGYSVSTPSLLKAGGCPQGHRIISLDDLTDDQQECYVCDRDRKIRKREAALALLDSLPADGTRICRNNHTVTKDNSRVVYDAKRGKYYTSCEECRKVQRAKAKKKKAVV